MYYFSPTLHRNRMLAELRKASKSGIMLDVTVIATGCCSECEQAFKDNRMTLEEAFEKQPIPYSKCKRTHNRCICLYGFIPLRDEKGRVVAE